MTAGRPIEKKDTVRFYHPKHEKMRTGIVFEKQDDRLIVIFGRGTKFDAPYAIVEHPSTEAAAIDLNKTTYFYDWSVVRILVSKAERVGHCPPAAWDRIYPIARSGLRRMVTLR